MTAYGHHITPETQRYLLSENPELRYQVRRPRKDRRNRRFHVWAQAQVEQRADFQRHLGFWHGLKRKLPGPPRPVTLVTGLIQHFVSLETLIASDKFSPFFNLNNLGYVHLMVNYLENFVDPYTGAHTNTIKGIWSQVKKKYKAMIGASKGKLPSPLGATKCNKAYEQQMFAIPFRQSL